MHLLHVLELELQAPNVVRSRLSGYIYYLSDLRQVIERGFHNICSCVGSNYRGCAGFRSLVHRSDLITGGFQAIGGEYFAQIGF